MRPLLLLTLTLSACFSGYRGSPGDIYQACVEDSECHSSICQAQPDGSSYCTQPCEDGCGDGTCTDGLCVVPR